MRLSLQWIFVCSALALAAGPAWPAGGPPVLQSQDFAGAAAGVAGGAPLQAGGGEGGGTGGAAAGVAAGAHLQVEGVQVADTGEAAAFDLERFEVFAKDARITVHGDTGDRVLRAPPSAYFRGILKGRPESRVFLARLEDGTPQGMVSGPGETYLIGGDRSASGEAKALGGPLVMHRVDPVLLKS